MRVLIGSTLAVIAAAGFATGYVWGGDHERKRQSLANRLSDCVTVLDYGAKCDGNTDDTAAQCYARYAAEAAGKPLLFPVDRICYRPYGIGDEACARYGVTRPRAPTP